MLSKKTNYLKSMHTDSGKIDLKNEQLLEQSQNEYIQHLKSLIPHHINFDKT